MNVSADSAVRSSDKDPVSILQLRAFALPHKTGKHLLQMSQSGAYGVLVRVLPTHFIAICIALSIHATCARVCNQSERGSRGTG